MDDGQLPIWSRQSGIERSLAAEVLREVAWLDHNDGIEL